MIYTSRYYNSLTGIGNDGVSPDGIMITTMAAITETLL